MAILPTSTNQASTSSSIFRSTSPHPAGNGVVNGAGAGGLSNGLGYGGSGFSGGFGGGRGVGQRVKLMAKRLLSFPQMDFELAAWQMTYLIFAPRRVYRNVYYHKQTKNTWARDDPAMLLLISACLCTAGLLWAVIYAHYPPLLVIRTMLSMVLVDFVLVGILMSSLLWAISNRFLTHSSHTHATDQKVEWAYSFDVHTNSFFPLFLHLYLAQLFLSPLITRNNWVCLWVGNTLYLAALTQYIYVTYLGYNALPFLIRSELLLFPIVILFALYIISLLGFNVSRGVLEAYFGLAASTATTVAAGVTT